MVDLGFGAGPQTTLELAGRLRAVAPDVRVVGLEIDPARVATARMLAGGAPGVEFALGGFELAGLAPSLVRAFNVLRQYPEDAVAPAWARLRGALAPGGLVVEGTCDERGRRCAWVLLDAAGPRSLTLAWDPADVARPGELAARLPKALIHRNVPGEGVHALLADLDRAWDVVAPHAAYGPRRRWRAAHDLLRGWGWPVAPARRPVRDNVVTVAWAAVAPRA
ncbi:class I SAM-dependent methyltransferase [Rhodococcus aerolatus]